MIEARVKVIQKRNSGYHSNIARFANRSIANSAGFEGAWSQVSVDYRYLKEVISDMCRWFYL